MSSYYGPGDPRNRGGLGAQPAIGIGGLRQQFQQPQQMQQRNQRFQPMQQKPQQFQPQFQQLGTQAQQLGQQMAQFGGRGGAGAYGQIQQPGAGIAATYQQGRLQQMMGERQRPQQMPYGGGPGFAKPLSPPPSAPGEAGGGAGGAPTSWKMSIEPMANGGMIPGYQNGGQVLLPYQMNTGGHVPMVYADGGWVPAYGIGGFFKGLGKLALKAAPMIAGAWNPALGAGVGALISGIKDKSLSSALVGGLKGYLGGKALNKGLKGADVAGGAEEGSGSLLGGLGSLFKGDAKGAAWSGLGDTAFNYLSDPKKVATLYPAMEKLSRDQAQGGPGSQIPSTYGAQSQAVMPQSATPGYVAPAQGYSTPIRAEGGLISLPVPGYGIGGFLKKLAKVAAFGPTQLLPKKIRDPINKIALKAAPIAANFLPIPGAGPLLSAGVGAVASGIEGKIDADRARDDAAAVPQAPQGAERRRFVQGVSQGPSAYTAEEQAVMPQSAADPTAQSYATVAQGGLISLPLPEYRKGGRVRDKGSDRKGKERKGRKSRRKPQQRRRTAPAVQPFQGFNPLGPRPPGPAQMGYAVPKPGGLQQVLGQMQQPQQMQQTGLHPVAQQLQESGIVPLTPPPPPPPPAVMQPAVMPPPPPPAVMQPAVIPPPPPPPDKMARADMGITDKGSARRPPGDDLKRVRPEFIDRAPVSSPPPVAPSSAPVALQIQQQIPQTAVTMPPPLPSGRNEGIGDEFVGRGPGKEDFEGFEPSQPQVPEPPPVVSSPAYSPTPDYSPVDVWGNPIIDEDDVKGYDEDQAEELAFIRKGQRTNPAAGQAALRDADARRQAARAAQEAQAAKDAQPNIPERILPTTGGQAPAGTPLATSSGTGRGSGFSGEQRWFDPNAPAPVERDIGGFSPHDLPRTSADFAAAGDAGGADLLSRLNAPAAPVQNYLSPAPVPGAAEGGLISQVPMEELEKLAAAAQQIESPGSQQIVEQAIEKYGLDLVNQIITMIQQQGPMTAPDGAVPGYGIGGFLKKLGKVAAFGPTQLLPKKIRDPINKFALKAAPVAANFLPIPGAGPLLSAGVGAVAQGIEGKIDADRARDAVAEEGGVAEQMSYGQEEMAAPQRRQAPQPQRYMPDPFLQQVPAQQGVASQMTYGQVGLNRGGLINGGGGDAMADDILVNAEMAMNGERQPIAVSAGEYIVPGDVLGHLGSGNTEEGGEVMDQFIEDVRMQRTGSPEQPPPVDLRDVLPGTYGERYA